MPTSHSETGSGNRLARESSPYLLLHAGNPVDWYPWGEEAFEKARSEGKPIFLSVGYSTCYWCHVMERECFSNVSIAERLNEGFVSIKLDREERPDLDEIYMTATQLLTQQGGWPNSVFLTPGLEPFFAGTYFPPEDWHGRPGFPRILAAIREAWQERRDLVLEQAGTVARAIRQHLDAERPVERLDAEAMVGATRTGLARRFDAEWGGFGSAPKFPSPANLLLLLELARGGDEQAREMLVQTLDRMARGGIQDQLGGGFHRYSTDREWLVPHFEKMLYDNASLAAVYAEAASLAPDLGFERVARRTLDFVLAELTGPEGGFLSAIDAETHAHEGAYYTWTRKELQEILGAEAYPLLAELFGLDGRPTFEMDRYVLHLPLRLQERAEAMQTSLAALLARLEPGMQTLLEARWKRERPLVDDKILTDWNGLMIGGMARAGSSLGERRYVEAAARAADFVLARLRSETGLLHSWRQGQARISAFLDDYAFLIDGLLALHAADGSSRWLAAARELLAEQDARLWDGKAGGYFAAGEDPRLLFRSKPAHDGALASGNGVAALNLLELARITGDATLRGRAALLLRAFGRGMEQYALAHVTLALALHRLGSVESGVATETAEATRASRPADEAERVVELSGALGAPTGDGGWRRFTVELRIAEGWHVNATPASADFLVATDVRVAQGQLRDVRYPEAGTLRSELAREPIAVYAGSVRIEGEIEPAPAGVPRVLVTYQACDETRCLSPVTREVALTP